MTRRMAITETLYLKRGRILHNHINFYVAVEPIGKYFYNLH